MNFPPHLLAPYFDWQASQVALANANTLAAKAAPDRIALLFSFDGTTLGTVVVWPGRTDNGTPGILVSSGSRLEILFRDYGALVGADWYTSTQGVPTGSLNVLEVFFRPNR